MGYSTNSQMVVRAEPLLEMLFRAISEGKSLSIPVLQSANLSSEYYNLRVILAAAARHPEVFNGRYKAIGTMVKVKVNAAMHCLVVSPKMTSGMMVDQMIRAEKPAELDEEILAQLAAHGITPESVNAAHLEEKRKRKKASFLPAFDPSVLKKDSTDE